ncbi:MAG TPA: hypothetical protein DHU79_05790 [Clostridiales bacterium]|nr:hypothetical protein [Clostridiales bacterium]
MFNYKNRIVRLYVVIADNTAATILPCDKHMPHRRLIFADNAVGNIASSPRQTVAYRRFQSTGGRDYDGLHQSTLIIACTAKFFKCFACRRAFLSQSATV